MRAQVNHLVNLRDTAGVSLTAGRAILAAGTFITLLTNNASTLIPLQVSFVYLNSAIAKFSAPIWVEGTALWYWIQHPGFNARPGELRIGLDLLANPFFAAATAWGTIALEIFLAVVILLGGRHRNVRLAAIIVGALFHLAIAVAIGLVSFFFAMLGGLTLALWRPRDAVPWSCVSRRSTIRRKVLNAE